MLKLVIPGVEMFDEVRSEFITTADVTVEFEHSLASLSKWEGEHQIPLMDKTQKTPEQMLDYFRCMTITPDVPPDLYYRLSESHVQALNEYIGKTATATTVFEGPGKKKANTEKITAELIYYWMVSFQIPFESQHWHLDKLLTLIKVCNVKNNAGKDVSKEDRMAWMKEQNSLRQAQNDTSG